MFKINGIFEKSDIFLDNIGYSFETSGWIFSTKTGTMCQILSRSAVLKKKVGFPTHKERYSSFYKKNPSASFEAMTNII